MTGYSKTSTPVSLHYYVAKLASLATCDALHLSAFVKLPDVIRAELGRHAWLQRREAMVSREVRVFDVYALDRLLQ